ncbi:MAG: tryptophan synthase subunit alpha [Candidatus Bathyarchaeota archaeon]|nr:tryptophan synthase subunit alpha [Candidatus Bathyarchaeota archaeon]
MSKIEKVFATLKAKKEGALIGYVTVGDPKPEITPLIADALIEGGVDILELGIPFSDPIADGPTIQAASLRAIKSGTTPKQVLKIASEIRKKHETPIVILTYYNPIFKMGLKNFFSLLNKNEIDGVVVPDLPIEESYHYRETAKNYCVDTIFLATPSTSEQRLLKIIQYSSGFLYLVSQFGVTGTRETLQDSTVRLIKKILPKTTGYIPLAVGFGISKPEHAKLIIQSGSEGVIVGSAFVKIVEKHQEDMDMMLDNIREFAFELKDAIKTRS